MVGLAENKANSALLELELWLSLAQIEELNGKEQNGTLTLLPVDPQKDS